MGVGNNLNDNWFYELDSVDSSPPKVCVVVARLLNRLVVRMWVVLIERSVVLNAIFVVFIVLFYPGQFIGGKCAEILACTACDRWRSVIRVLDEILYPEWYNNIRTYLCNLIFRNISTESRYSPRTRKYAGLFVI